ncbi:MAG: rod shape-determining protein MreC [Epulopiscium sp. Nuni2H_MBin001]|nr:MAG: rod shape-determining protein MreC [Epulopiscium sp. Nuni2H_MBin001]
MVLTFIGRRYDIALISAVADIITYPFQKVITLVTRSVSGGLQHFQDMQTLIDSNEVLANENAQLSYENAILAQFKTENEQLKSLLELDQRYKEYPSSGANVIGKDPGNWYQSFIIDKGIINGIAKNDIVLANGALVGYISEADPLSSTVLSIIDDRSYASVQVVRSSDVGILSGDIELTSAGVAIMEVNINADIVAGDQIITSYLSDRYPPGIQVGEVQEVVVGDNGLVQYAYVDPIADFQNLQHVLIISTTEQVEQ